jgi:pyruvate/2-oxoglutarate dehydrogenase complex dihydrolipoamide acyltransferase (E2) component
LRGFDWPIGVAMFGPAILAVVLGPPAPQDATLELAPIVRTVRVPVDGPGEVIVTVRSNGGYTADFEPAEGSVPAPPAPFPTPPGPAPTPPAPNPAEDDLTMAARAYMRAAGVSLDEAAAQVERGLIADHNAVLDYVAARRNVARDAFGTLLDTRIKPYIDDAGRITGPVGYANTLRIAARAAK